MSDYILPREVDELLKLSPGKAARLARRGLLPAIILPDKSIRFEKTVLSNYLNSRLALCRAASTNGGAA